MYAMGTVILNDDASANRARVEHCYAGSATEQVYPGSHNGD